jgi:hypothetical protein
MDGLPDINRNQTTLPQESVSSATPAPTEVKIRTMRSDIAGLTASGGGLPKFENIKVSGLSLDAKTDAVAAAKSGAFMAVVITVVALIILGVIGYFGYRIVVVGSL